MSATSATFDPEGWDQCSTSQTQRRPQSVGTFTILLFLDQRRRFFTPVKVVQVTNETTIRAMIAKDTSPQP